MHSVVRAATVAMAMLGFCLVGASTPVWFGHAYVGGVDCGSPVDEDARSEPVAPAAYDADRDGEDPSCQAELSQARTTGILMVVAGVLLMVGAGLALLAGRDPDRGLISARARVEGDEPRP